jgi:hypothetical protein
MKYYLRFVLYLKADEILIEVCIVEREMCPWAISKYFGD